MRLVTRDFLTLCCIFTILCPAMSECIDERLVDFAVRYFTSKEVKIMTFTFCQNLSESIRLQKELFVKGLQSDWLDLRILNESILVRRVTSKYWKIGVFLDLNCPQSINVLQVTNRNHLFSLRHSLTFWLVVASENFSRDILEAEISALVPHVSDPMKFLMEPYADQKNAEYLLKINEQVNAEFINGYDNSYVAAGGTNMGNKTIITNLLESNVFLNNEITIAVPESRENGVLYSLVSFYKPSAEIRGKIIDVGKVRYGDGENYLLELDKGKRKINLENSLLKAASAIFQPKAFTTIDDLATRESDIWSKMTYPHVKLLADDLNFRIIIKFFDDYGWQTNGTFGHLIGQLQQKKADLSAAGLLMRSDRFGIIDYLQCPFRLQTGILFREPSLSSVSNIFVLPFSRGIWICIGVITVLTVIVLRCHAILGKKFLPEDSNISSIFDIANYIMGAICQQGFPTTPNSQSARISVLVLLLTSLALFTSYSACIVALLQSSSSAILSVSDITTSSLEVGIQANFPLYKVLIKEAVHPVLKEFYRRKVLSKGEKAFCERREGIERMRTGMFAFEVELTAGYKLISETYEEREKCGIKEIDLIPKPFICIALRKCSPYREAFMQRLVKQNEAGLFDRSWKLWVDQKPKCEVERIGFISVGLIEFRPALVAFGYGIFGALVVFCMEVLYGKCYVDRATRRPKTREGFFMDKNDGMMKTTCHHLGRIEHRTQCLGWNSVFHEL